jgi:hypothetical protein
MHDPIQSHNTVPLKKLLTFYFMQDREPPGEDAHLQHQKDVSQDLTWQVLPQGLSIFFVSLLCADLFAVLVSPLPLYLAFTSSFFINFEFCLVPKIMNLICFLFVQVKSDYLLIFLAKHNPGSSWSHMTAAEKVIFTIENPRKSVLFKKMYSFQQLTESYYLDSL